MRLPESFSLLLLLRAWTVTAHGTHGASKLTAPIVYIQDPISQPPSYLNTAPGKIRPETARLIFADRLGISHLYSLQDADDTVIGQLNKYGGDQHTFGFQRQQWGQSKVVVIIDGVEDKPDFLSPLSTFTMSETPSRIQNEQLIGRLHAESKEGRPGPYNSGQSSAPIQRFHNDLQEWISKSCHSMRGREEGEVAVVHISLNHDCDKDGKAYPQILRMLASVAQEEDMKLTIAAMPSSPSKRSKSTTPYGPVGSDGLPTARLQRRDEEILFEPLSSTATNAPANHATSKPQIFATPSSYPFVAQCYASTADCQKGTGNCTGHGECVLKAKTAASGDEGSTECYVCSCNKPEVVYNDDGTTKTTYFGGSVCQKKDISAPFWILTLTAGSLLALVGFGVSMLYAMGQAELPSVIGAGVSGPRAK